jgi:ketosteroid isomerase-like protein
MVTIVHPHETLIRTFYEAFAARDAEKMAACYHENIFFSDPAFPALHGREASDMWRMLVARGKDLKITLHSAGADDSGGQAVWEAHYTFSQTGRFVINRIEATFAFRDGKIVRHRDNFPFWKWAGQALGPVGKLLGWSWPIKALVRKKAAASLAAFRARQ